MASSPYLFCSARLGFRGWHETDHAPFAQLNADPAVMAHFPAPLSAAESRQAIQRLNQHLEEHGFTFFAVDRLSDGSFLGFIGMVNIRFEAAFTPGVEIGWRLKKDAWGQGFATEGARRCMAFGFEKLDFSRIYSFTATENQRSERVMQRIGMEKVGEFDHPWVEQGHRLQRHVLYCAFPPGHAEGRAV